MKKNIDYKRWLIWTYKKEVILFTCIVLAVFGVISAARTIISQNNSEVAAFESNIEMNAYRLVVNGNDLGLVQSLEVGEKAIKQAMNMLINDIGYDPEVEPEIRYYEEYSENAEYVQESMLSASIKDALKNAINVIKEDAYVMKIGDNVTIALESKEDVEKVLQAAQDIFVSDNVNYKVQLDANEHNSLVETPRTVLVNEIEEEDRTYTSLPLDATEAIEEAQEVYVEEDMVLDPMYNGTTVDVDFTEEVIVVETFVSPEEILDVQTAIELVTKENEEPKLYYVESGDCPSIIAEKNNMPLSQLYDLNPGLQDTKFIQIDDELVVMVPEPELSITTKEETKYVVSIDRGTTYVKNPDKYVGSNTVIDAGYDGELEVSAVITKVNGKETERIVTGEEVILEAKDKVVSQGTKPLPAKGATGMFVPPLENYTITSRYGYRGSGFHYGVDMANSIGTTVRATDGGVVTYAGWMSGYGYLVIIDHGDGVTSRYGHNSSLSVSVGDQVSQYQEIAKLGSTGRSSGPHVHFEIRFDGVAVNPLDYLEYY